MNRQTNPFKSASAKFQPSGVYFGIIEGVDGKRLDVAVPRLTGTAVFPNVEFADGDLTTAPQVGERVFVTFKEGRQGDLVILGRMSSSLSTAYVDPSGAVTGDFLRYDGTSWVPDAGEGVAAGGSTNQVLTKNSGSNYDTEWSYAASSTRTGLKSTWFYFSPSLGVSDTTSQPAQSRLVAFPYQFDVASTGDRVSLEVTTTAASSTVRLGLYLPGADGMPNALYKDFGTIDSATATGVVTITISETIPRGLYWVCSASQGGVPTVRGRGIANAIVPQATGGNVNAYAVYVDGVTGALPSTFGSPGQYQLNIPKIGFRGA